jgi:RecJ-like exonuclease
VQSALQSAADEIRSLAEEKREGAQNIEEGFGHETEKSQELNDIADQLDSWADEVENADVPDLSDPEEVDCEECDGTGEVESVVAEGDTSFDTNCSECNGTGQVTPDEPTEDQLAEWLDEVRDAVSIVDESPV